MEDSPEIPDYDGSPEDEPVTAVKEEPDGEVQPARGAGPQAAKLEATGQDFKHWMPERVKKALEGGDNFEAFRRARKFRYLHAFSGPVDILAKQIAEECKRERLEFEAVSLDRKTDRTLDLSKVAAYQELGRRIDEGEFDGFHGGFPCSSFSMARYNRPDRGPPPVRSGAELYGLSTNNRAQQREADLGTLMASQCSWLCERQVKSCRRRGVPEVATLENPPGTKESGSAWQLQELVDVMNRINGMAVEFNTCSYQSKRRERWYKPSRWAGKLDGLTGLARVCRCPNWVVHTPLVGKSRTEEAGAYPEELCQEVAKRIVACWKKTLNLEWWRHLASERACEVSSLQKAWLRNEEKRNDQRCHGTRREKATPITDTLDGNNVEVDYAPENARPSKKSRREQQNDFCLGGMRNPSIAVSRLALVRELGVRIRREWEVFAESHPRALKLGKAYGTSKAAFDEEVAAAWKERLRAILVVKAPDGITLRESVEFNSPLDPDMWDSWAREARDPERHLGQWAREGAPLGMEVRVDPSHGIFPTVDAVPGTEVDPAPELDQMRGVRNYSSMEEQMEDAEIEVERYMKCGYVKQLPWDWVVERFGTGTVSRLALIVKEKTDGSKKRRVIIDMRRSQGNRRATVDERIVLPRAQDVILMARDMTAKRGQLADAEAEVGVPVWRRSSEPGMEWVLIDLKHAFCHFPVHSRELTHCISPGLTEGSRRRRW